MPPHEHGLRLLNRLVASSYHELQETEPPRDELFSVMVKCAFKLADAAATAGATFLSARAKEFAEDPTDEGLHELHQAFRATRAQLVNDGVLPSAGGAPASPAEGWGAR